MTYVSTGSLGHILGLPPEILRMVFQRTMISSEEEGFSSSPELTALSISVTCHTFREIALSLPEFWTQINLLWDQPVIELYLERAGANSLVSVYHCAREAAETVDSDSSEDDGLAASDASARSSGDSPDRDRSPLSANALDDDERPSPAPEISPLKASNLTAGLLARVRSLQLDERKQGARAGLFMMLAQTALRQAQALSALESFILLCDDFTNIHFAESHHFERLKTLKLRYVVLPNNSRLLASTITDLALHGVVFVSHATSSPVLVLARMPLLRRLELVSVTGVSTTSSGNVAVVELRQLRYFAMELEADMTIFLLENVHFPTSTELHCRVGGANRTLANASQSERNEALPLRNYAAHLLSAMRMRYQPALAVSGNAFTTISITSLGQFDGCRITLENPTITNHLVPHLPERISLQLMDANSGPPSHVDVAKLIAVVIPLLPSPDSAYIKLVVGPVPWAREQGAWSGGFGIALSSIVAVEVSGIAGEGLLAALRSLNPELFPRLSSVTIKHLSPAAIRKQVRAVKEKRPNLDIMLASVPLF